MCRSARAIGRGPLAALALPLRLAAIHPAEQGVQAAARRLPHRARRGARVLSDLVLGVELLRLTQGRLVGVGVRVRR